MKKNGIIIILLISMLLTSCNNNKDEVASPTNFIEKELQFVFQSDDDYLYEDLKTLDIFINSGEESKMSLEAQGIWADYIKKEMGVYPKIHYVSYGYRTLTEEASFIDTEFQGIYYSDTHYMTLGIADTSMIYLEEYINIKKYPEEVQHLMVDNYSRVLILPTSYNKSYQYRTYNKGILNEFDIVIPTTVEEFYILAKLISEQNEGKDEKRYIASFSLNTITEDLLDIFMAFGCFSNSTLSYSRGSTIGYNPHKEEIEYMLYNENLQFALEYINKLYSEGLLYMIPNKEIVEDQIIVSFYGQERPFYYMDETYGLYLDGTSTVSNIYCNESISGFSILRNTTNPKAIISFFENKVFTTQQAQMTFEYGIKDINYTIRGTELFLINEEKMVVPNMTIKWYGDFDKIYMKISDDKEHEITSKTHEIEQIISNLPSEKIYFADRNIDFISLNNKILYSDMEEANFKFAFLCNEILIYKLSVEQAIEVYREKMINKINIDSFSDFLKK